MGFIMKGLREERNEVKQATLRKKNNVCQRLTYAIGSIAAVFVAYGIARYNLTPANNNIADGIGAVQPLEQGIMYKLGAPIKGFSPPQQISGEERVKQYNDMRNSITEIQGKYEKHSQFIEAVLQGNVAKVKEFLNDDTLDINFIDREGKTALLHASKENLEIVKILLADKRTDINAADRSGYTPLLIAGTANNQPIVKALLADERTNIDMHISAVKDTSLLANVMVNDADIVKLIAEKLYQTAQEKNYINSDVNYQEYSDAIVAHTYLHAISTNIHSTSPQYREMFDKNPQGLINELANQYSKNNFKDINKCINWVLENLDAIEVKPDASKEENSHAEQVIRKRNTEIHRAI